MKKNWIAGFFLPAINATVFSYQMQFSPTCIALHGLCSNSLEYTYVVGAALWRSVKYEKVPMYLCGVFQLYISLSFFKIVFRLPQMLFSSSSPKSMFQYNFYVTRKIFCAALKHENLFSLAFFSFKPIECDTGCCDGYQKQRFPSKDCFDSWGLCPEGRKLSHILG